MTVGLPVSVVWLRSKQRLLYLGLTRFTGLWNLETWCPQPLRKFGLVIPGLILFLAFVIPLWLTR